MTRRADFQSSVLVGFANAPEHLALSLAGRLRAGLLEGGAGSVESAPPVLSDVMHRSSGWDR
jgi:hypothetical protein